MVFLVLGRLCALLIIRHIGLQGAGGWGEAEGVGAVGPVLFDPAEIPVALEHLAPGLGSMEKGGFGFLGGSACEGAWGTVGRSVVGYGAGLGCPAGLQGVQQIPEGGPFAEFFGHLCEGVAVEGGAGQLAQQQGGVKQAAFLCDGGVTGDELGEMRQPEQAGAGVEIVRVGGI